MEMGINNKYLAIIKLIILIQAGSLLSACGGGSESASVPLVLDAPIAYVKRPVLYDMNGNLVPIDITDPIAFHPGGDLYIRDRATSAAEEINITRRFTGGMGDVKDVEFNADGTKIIFAMRAADIPNTQPEDQPKWDIWEYEIETDTLSRVMPESLAQEHQDVSPAYLPTGEIIYTSTRQLTNQAILGDEGKPAFSGLTENRQQKALVLHRMNPDGSPPINVRPQLSFNQSHDLDPIVLSNGRILFSRWDDTLNGINLYTINPDGTELNIVYGAHSHNTGSGGSAIQFLKTAELENGNILALLAPFNGQSGGGMLVEIDINSYIDNTVGVNSTLIGPAQENIVDTNIITNGNPSPGGLYGTAYPLNDGTDRYLVSWTPCRLQNPSTGVILPCSTDNLADPALVEAPPLFGLFMFDAAENTQVPVVKPAEGIMYTDVAVASPSPAPNVIPDKVEGLGPFDLDSGLISQNVGILNINSVYQFDENDPMPDITRYSDPGSADYTTRPARFLRVLKAVSIPDNEDLDGDRNSSLDREAFGVAGNDMYEIIGYAPIEPDGSVKIKVPANVPLSFSILDADGKREPLFGRHDNWIQVRAGDTLNCVGCHVHTNNADTKHGRPGAPVERYSGYQQHAASIMAGTEFFPGTDMSLVPNFGETMAEMRTRLDPTAMDLTVDLIGYNDFWPTPTNPNLIPRPANEADIRANAATLALYRDIPHVISANATAPTSTTCQDQWQTTFPPCRIVIHYEEHIHPIWSEPRGGSECINCHTNTLPMAPPAGQLDLTDGFTDRGGLIQYKAYRELLENDTEQVYDMGLVDRYDLVQQFDAMGNPILDMMGNPVFLPDSSAYINQWPRSITPGNALASGRFFDRFKNPANTDHFGILTDAELKLLIEWVDIGAQYYNDPFAVDANRFIN